MWHVNDDEDNIYDCRYAPALWNHYVAAQLAEPRTNNICEAWNRRFNMAVNKHHPSLYSLLREFKREKRNGRNDPEVRPGEAPAGTTEEEISHGNGEDPEDFSPLPRIQGCKWCP